LLFVLFINYCYAIDGYDFKNFYGYGSNSYQLEGPDDLVGAFGSRTGSKFAEYETQGFKRRLPQISPQSYYDSRDNYAFYSSYSPLGRYSKPDFDTYVNTGGYSYQNQLKTYKQQLDSTLPLIVLLAKQLSSTQPVIQNFVNPTLPASNLKYSSYESPQKVIKRYGESNQNNLKQDKRQLKVKKIVMEDMVMERNA
jgi:hypothetical protein